MACQSLLCGAADQFNMAKALLEAGADPVAKDKVRGCMDTQWPAHISPCCCGRGSASPAAICCKACNIA